MKKNRILFALFIISSFLSVFTTYSQDYYSTTHFSENYGFTGSTVYATSQDSLGYIWICTNAGLVRYDGINFKAFVVEDGIIDLEIFNMDVDSQNHIFLYNFSNKANFYYQGKFHNVQNDSALFDVQFQSNPNSNFHKEDNAFILSTNGINYFFI